MVWFLLEVEGYDKSIYGVRIVLSFSDSLECYLLSYSVVIDKAFKMNKNWKSFRFPLPTYSV